MPIPFWGSLAPCTKFCTLEAGVGSVCRLGMNTENPNHFGHVVIRPSVHSVLPAAVLGLAVLIFAEHIRVFAPRILLNGSHERRGVFLAWYACTFYGLYRQFRWLFMYLNECWYRLLPTQAVLFLTEAACLLLLWSCYRAYPRSPGGCAACAGGELQRADDPFRNANHGRVVVKLPDWVLHVKLWHLLFFLVESNLPALLVGPSPVGALVGVFVKDSFRNSFFLAEDVLFLWIFADHSRLRGHMQSGRVWAGLLVSHLGFYLFVNFLWEGNVS